MKILAVFALSFCLAGCYAATEAEIPAHAMHDFVGHPVAVTPVGSALSSPEVVTSRGVMAYHRDLASCRAAAARDEGSGDDLAALQRALLDRPLKGSVSVIYRTGDVALVRDKIVKECLSQRGYVVRN